MRVSDTWPLGPVLKAARERAGISKREAARRAAVYRGETFSEQLWRRLETGYYTVQGERIPLTGRDGANKGAGADTVRAAALAVNLDVGYALTLVGYPATTFDKPVDPVDEATREFKGIYATFEKAWGPERAREAMRRALSDRDTEPNRSANGVTG